MMLEPHQQRNEINKGSLPGGDIHTLKILCNHASRNLGPRSGYGVTHDRWVCASERFDN